MHVGEPVAVVIAETALAAQDAAELVAVDYEEDEARGRRAGRGESRARRSCGRRRPATSRSTGRASPRTRTPMRARSRASSRPPRTVARVEVHEPAAGRRHHGAARRDRELRRDRPTAITLRACSQSAGALRDNILGIMNWPKERLRVITEDVGGAFGLKTGAYPEYIALMVGAKLTGRAVHWMSTPRPRPSSATARRATPSPRPSLRSTRRAGSWRCASATSPTWAPISARSAPTSRRSISRAAFPACTTSSTSTWASRCVFTNTMPTSPYRGAGRPEANYVLETAWSTRRRASPASIRSSCAAAT